MRIIKIIEYIINNIISQKHSQDLKIRPEYLF